MTEYKLPAPGTKILFACFPVDGHFNPLTGLAKHLQNNGCEVYWYTSKYFTERLDKLNIPYFLFDKAKDIDITRVDEAYPERKAINNKVKKLNFDIINLFVNRAAEYYADIQELHKQFPFELMIADIAFTAIPFVKEKMHIPVLTIGIMPLGQTSKDTAPNGLGMVPAKNILDKLKQNFLKFIAGNFLFAPMNKAYATILRDNGIDPENLSVFDMIYKKSTMVLQIGSKGFEYTRSDMGSNIEFVGALLAYQNKKEKQWFNDKISLYDKIVLVTQGTVEKESTKLIIPTLEAFKNSDTLVIVTTGGSNTDELRKKYNYENIIIEDFIPFNDVMPHADVYITNGGYGGTLLSITNGLPMVAAGVHEGKNEINARIGYFKLGINLNTETPTSQQIKDAAEKVMRNKEYAANVKALCNEFERYKPLELSASFAAQLINQNQAHVQRSSKPHVDIAIS